MRKLNSKNKVKEEKLRNGGLKKLAYLLKEDRETRYWLSQNTHTHSHGGRAAGCPVHSSAPLWIFGRYYQRMQLPGLSPCVYDKICKRGPEAEKWWYCWYYNWKWWNVLEDHYSSVTDTKIIGCYHTGLTQKGKRIGVKREKKRPEKHRRLNSKLGLWMPWFSAPSQQSRCKRVESTSHELGMKWPVT